MEQINITTTQNVRLSYTAAGVGLRILAGLLDLLFVYTYILIIVSICSLFITKNYYSNNFEENENMNQIMYGILIVLLLPALTYNLLCETFLNGQSFGKKIIKIKVIKLDGTQPNFGSYLIRSMFRLIDRPFIALITVTATKNSQRFGDMIAGTTVIQLNKKISLLDTILKQQQSDYKIVYPQISLMSDTDANIIKEVLDFNSAQNQEQHIAILAKKIKNKYGISSVHDSDVLFLNTLLSDYTHYQFER